MFREGIKRDAKLPSHVSHVGIGGESRRALRAVRPSDNSDEQFASLPVRSDHDVADRDVVNKPHQPARKCSVARGYAAGMAKRGADVLHTFISESRGSR